MPWFEGNVLLERGEPTLGHIGVEAGRVVAAGKGPSPEPVTARGWIVPAPVNAHTHVADAALRGRPGMPRTLPEAVGPGGWKHQQLARTSGAELAAGVAAYVDEMAACGTQAFLDFREGGAAGATHLRALQPELAVHAVVYGRPEKPGFSSAEAEAVLEASDGIGLSALRDFPRRRDVEGWAEAAHAARKPFALHVSEAVREDVDAALALEPRFLVHAAQATPTDLDDIAHARVPVVLCPRSNAHWGLRPPVARMREAGVRIALGTDNGMIGTGDIWAEAAALRTLDPGLDIAQTLRCATWNGRALAGLATSWPPARGAGAEWVVLPPDPLPRAAPGRRRPALAPRQEGEA